MATSIKVQHSVEGDGDYDSDGAGVNIRDERPAGFKLKRTNTEKNITEARSTSDNLNNESVGDKPSASKKHVRNGLDHLHGIPTKTGSTNLPINEETPKTMFEGSMTWWDKAQALLYYTEQMWPTCTNCDFAEFIKEFWVPSIDKSIRTVKNDPSQKLHLQPEDVEACIVGAAKDQSLPTLLHLLLGSQKIERKKKKGEKNYSYIVAKDPFTTADQVKSTFIKREELLKYLMKHPNKPYEQRVRCDRGVPLLCALDFFREVPTEPGTPNPFVQLLVTENPMESAFQLQSPDNADDKDEGEWSAESDLEDDEPNKRAAPMPAKNDPTPVYDRIHQLLPQVCSPDSQGLECVTKLLPQLSKECLATKDNDGNTILHIVARYKYSCDESKEARERLLRIIRGLVHTYPDAVGVLNKNSESPYLHRVKTYLKAKEDAEPRVKEENNQGKEQRLKQALQALQEDTIAFYLKEQCIRQKGLAEALTLLYAPDDKEREQEPRFYLNLSGTRYEGKEFKRSKVDAFLEMLSLDNILKFVRIVPFTIVDDTIATQDIATPSGGGKQIQGQAGDIGTLAEPDKDSRPNNCEIVFQYLKLKVPVKTIYEVAVEEANIYDRSTPPHTDEAILQCLAKSSPREQEIQPCWPQIMTWDWQKIDICTEVLVKCAPNVETVYLYTSGNDAILRSWSSYEGLIVLKNLKNIYLTVCRAHVLETASSIRQSIENFRTRLSQLCNSTQAPGLGAEVIKECTSRVIEIYIDNECLKEFDKFGSPQDSVYPSGIDHVPATDKQELREMLQTPIWLKKMESFTNYIINCPDTIKHPIKVAILDDGYDMIDNQDLEPDSIPVFRAMDPDTSIPFRPNKSKFSDRHYMAPYSSEKGHGTMMVHCIQRLCPKARLYIAKLKSNPDGNGPTPASAADAIQWAIKRKVHIISMSWSIRTTPSTESNASQEERDLKAAIDKAKLHNILMFGASSDEGNNGANDPVIYPAAADGVFCIVPADKHGQLRPTVGAERNRKYTYAFPGELEEDGPYRGSSVATALAAGFTALLLHSAAISGYAKPEKLKLLRKYENIGKVFEGLLVTDTKYVGVVYNFPECVCKGDWDRFGKSALTDLLKKILGKIV